MVFADISILQGFRVDLALFSQTREAIFFQLRAALLSAVFADWSRAQQTSWARRSTWRLTEAADGCLSTATKWWPCRALLDLQANFIRCNTDYFTSVWGLREATRNLVLIIHMYKWVFPQSRLSPSGTRIMSNNFINTKCGKTPLNIQQNAGWREMPLIHYVLSIWTLWYMIWYFEFHLYRSKCRILCGKTLHSWLKPHVAQWFQ